MVYFNRFAKRISIASTLMLLSFQASAAYVTTVKSGDSNATAETEFEKVLAEGGTITFEEGAWTINLANSTYKALGDVTIIGQNSTDSSDPDLMGAYEESEFVKTTLTMTGSCMRLTDSCANLTIRDLKWVETGLEVEARHQANVDLDNVFFDITSWSTGEWNKNVFDTNDGIQGTIDHCSFIGFGMRAIKINRSVDQDQYPITQAGKLTVNRCKFRPDPSMYSTKKRCRA